MEEFNIFNLSKREYYAAHAPMPIPDWFKIGDCHGMPVPPAVPTHWNAAQAAMFSDIKEGRLPLSIGMPEVMEFYVEWRTERDRQIAWRDQQREKKFFSWRWHYADMMLKMECEPEIN